MDYTDEDVSDIVAAILHSLKRVFPDGREIKLDGQCTDSGGGGTKHAFSRAMTEKDLTISLFDMHLFIA